MGSLIYILILTCHKGARVSYSRRGNLHSGDPAREPAKTAPVFRVAFLRSFHRAPGASVGGRRAS